MNETVISWTAVNMATVFLMVLLGSAIVMAVGNVISKARATRD